MSENKSWTDVLLPASLIAGLVVLLSLNVGPGATEPTAGRFEHWLEIVVNFVALVAELAAALVICAGIFGALGGYFLKRAVSIRRDLGRALALGLEFTIASDILQTAIAPTRQELVTLTTVVLLRTLLTYFLEREIKDQTAID